MFESNSQQQQEIKKKKELQQQQQQQDAFIKNTPSLPGFSLPTNLNTFVTNKKKNLQQQQQQQQQQLSRPRLSNLRSTWLSQQSIEEDAFAEDKLIDIALPFITNELVDKDGVIEKEISFLITTATSLCLVSATLSSIFTSHKVVNSLSLGYSSIIFAWNQVADIKKHLEYIIFSSVCMLGITTLLSHNMYNNNASLLSWINCTTTCLSIILFSIVTRLSKANELLQQESDDRIKLHQSKSQAAIDQVLDNYADKRHLFLSTVSQEIRDASLMVMATLEQFSPSSILTNTHELLSACSIAVPIASISAINTTIKQACHISSHLNLVSRMLRETDPVNTIPEENRVKSIVSKEFDVSELIQNVGDALAGMSAKLGVHFVIYHTDNGLYFSNVIGDEDAIKHALINLLRNILEGCTPGACIELGLFITSIPDTPHVKVVFDIIQTASPAIPAGVTAALIPNANFTAQLLSYIDGHMELEDLGKNKTRVEVTLELYPGCNSDQRLLFIEKPSQILEKQLSNIRFSNEPTLEDLSLFISQLKGVKMILHAPEKSMFAKHLTSCLTGWNTDISHVPVLGYSAEDLNNNDEGSNAGSDSDNSSAASQPLFLKTPGGVSSDNTIHSILSASNNNNPPLPSNRSVSNVSNSSSSTASKIPSPAIEEDHIHSIPPAFILIDDDVLTLERKLREFRDKPQHAPLQHTQRRHRRSKSRNATEMLHGTVALIFFTSLTNYKRVRDTIHWISTLDLPPYMPRVVVVPKPAGPRRFLTALHTAWNNAIVEPQFIPIATSPLSPFIGQHQHMSPVQPSSSHHDSSGGGSLATPGLSTHNNPLMTPHEVTSTTQSRFSPGSTRRANMSGMRVHSPLGIETAEKGNYFFDSPTSAGIINNNNAASATTNNSMNTVRPGGPVKLNTSPLIAASGSMNPAANNNGGGGIHTPGGISSTGGSTTSNPTPNEIKRRLRSHSNTFLQPANNNGGRRAMVDLSISQMSPMMMNNKPTPVQEEDEPNSSSNQSSMDSTRPMLTSSTATSSTTSGGGNSSTESIIPILPPTSVPTTNAVLPVNDTIPSPKDHHKEEKPTVTTKPKSKLNFKISNRKKKDKSNQSDKPSPPITVLIVEDNMINQAILSTWMKKHSIKFSVACDGKEAVEKWKGGGFHLILMDIQLPVMDGIQATKMIRGIEKERKIGVLPSNVMLQEVEEVVKEVVEEVENDPVMKPSTSTTTIDTTNSSFQSPVIIVALTASSLESDRQAALAAGCNDFLTKPVSLEWLEKKITEWGCMQALIDFEGWKKWKRSTIMDEPTKATTTRSEALLVSKLKKEAFLATGTVAKEANLIEREHLAQRTKELLKDEARVIVLVGINKRRMSTVIMEDDSNKTLKKRASDPDLQSNELSIPKQLEAREQKLIQQEQERLMRLEQEEDDLEDDDDDDV